MGPIPNMKKMPIWSWKWRFVVGDALNGISVYALLNSLFDLT